MASSVRAAAKRYVVDRRGVKEGIILPLAEYRQLLEDLHDLAKMRWRTIVGLLTLLLYPSSEALAQAYRVGVDPRVELMSIVFRLAGNGEYTQGRFPSYLDAIDRHFGPYRDHKAVQIAKELAQTDSVGFDAPMDLAVHLEDVDSLAERIPFDRPDADLDERWHGVKARRFVESLRSFVADTKFTEFLKSQQPLYDVTNTRLRKFVETDLDLGWYTRFFGAHSPVRLIIVPGLVNGGPSYAAGFVGKDGVKEMYAIPGVWEVDSEGLPQLTSSDFLGVTVHEFAHSYSNALVDKYYSQMAKAGDELYEVLGSAMRRQAYGDGKSLLYESMVRAATIRYIFDHRGPEAARSAMESERNNSFLWIGGLCDLLTSYEKNREKYPTLESFMPNVVRFFNDEAPRIGEMQRHYDEARPKVVSMNIVNHSGNVDPAVTEIAVRFDRPMRKEADPLAVGDPRLMKARFDITGTTLSFGVSLEPGREYRFRLAWPGGSPIVSAEGVPINDYLIEFHTKRFGAKSVPQ